MAKKVITDKKGYNFSVALLIITIIVAAATVTVFVIACVCSTNISEASIALSQQRITADDFMAIRNKYQNLNNISTFLSFVGIPVSIALALLTKFSFNKATIELSNQTNSDQFEVYKTLKK